MNGSFGEKYLLNKIRESRLNGLMQLLSGRVLYSVFNFLRNVIIIRMISIEDYGIASLFILTYMFFQMLNDVSVDKIIVQSENSVDDNFVGTAQSLYFLMSWTIALILFSSAPLIADFFNQHSLVLTFRFLAIIPIVDSFKNLRIFLEQRKLQYKKEINSQVYSQLIALACTYPICYCFRNYISVLYIILIQQLSFVFFTHLYSQWKFKLSLNLNYVKEMVFFSYPLLLNSLLMFFVMQGDRSIIAKYYDEKLLGLFSIVQGFVLMPVLMLGKINTSMLLPILANSKNDVQKMKINFKISLNIVVLTSGILAIFYFFLGEMIIEVVYSKKHELINWLVTIIALSQLLRIVRTVLSTTSMAIAKTKFLMYSSIVRLSIFGSSFFLAINGYSIILICIMSVLGELIAFSFNYLLLRKTKYNLRGTLSFALVILVLVVGMLLFKKFAFQDAGVLMNFSSWFVFTLFMLALGWKFKLHEQLAAVRGTPSKG